MKKIILGISLLASFCFSDPYLKEGIKAGEDISNIDLSSFVKGDKNKYKISFGEIYERDITYKNKTMKEVYSFNQNKLSLIFLLDDTDKDFVDIELEEKGNIKFLSGYIKTTEKEDKFNYTVKDDYFGMLNVYFDELKNGMTKKITSNTTYGKKIENKTAKIDSENYIGISILKNCAVKEAHKDCTSCEFIEGKTKTYNCETLYINHVLK